MFYYTGDIHGQSHKLISFIDSHPLGNDDVIVILGDAGFNYYGNSNGDSFFKREINSLGVTIFCIHGNHEQRPEAIPSYKLKYMNGGRVFIEDEFPNLIFAKDGEIFDLGGLKTIVLGGAYSVDKYYRLLNGFHWFENEQPSEQIKIDVDLSLEKCKWQVDTVLSHTCPYKYIPKEAFLPGINQTLVDNSTEHWLDNIENKLSYKHWLCGHWHIDKKMNKLRFLMDDFIVLPETTNDSKK